LICTSLSLYRDEGALWTREHELNKLSGVICSLAFLAHTTVQGVLSFFKSQPEDLRATHPLLDEILTDAHVSSVHEGQYVINPVWCEHTFALCDS
jgi:hypothetical protein